MLSAYTCIHVYVWMCGSSCMCEQWTSSQARTHIVCLEHVEQPNQTKFVFVYIVTKLNLVLEMDITEYMAC